MLLQHYWLISKAFGFMPNHLIITKLAVRGFDNNYLELIHNYLSNRKQRVKVKSAYSIWKNIFMVFHKVPYLNPCFSIYTYVKQKLQKQAYPSFGLKYSPIQAMFEIGKWPNTTNKYRRVYISI